MILLDSHCDTPSQIKRLRNLSLDNDHSHIDFPKLRRGGVDAAFFALYTPASFDSEKAYDHANELLSLTKSAVDAEDGVFLAHSPEDVRKNASKGHLSVCIGMENGSPLGSSLGRIDEFHERGVRYITLCHSKDNLICDSCAEAGTWNGLSPFGRDVVERMNELGMLIDISHASDQTFWDVLSVSRKPIVATHSCCRALASHPRNMTDEMIRALADKGGVIQINFYPAFLDDDFAKLLNESGLYDWGEVIEDRFIANPADAMARSQWYGVLDRLQQLQRPSFRRIADHIDHAVKVGGIDHVGLGSDFDGICVTPQGMEDASCFPVLIDELRRRGYSEGDIEKIAGGNFLRVWEA